MSVFSGHLEGVFGGKLLFIGPISETIDSVLDLGSNWFCAGNHLISENFRKNIYNQFYY
ncbi:hypothetical protein [Leptospira meyeri]|uniref:hypothetical protein n=1 Tax=Leptospira meyeri TaxID=29508 RepID=UPI0013FE465A|nr:hypothetical protein [Leptospira meyeri]MCW7487367.1 hypothetical protein [Leptospira meyeri]